MSTQTVVINLFGEACTGKSTHATGLYSLMKKKGYSVELIREWVKDVFYEGHGSMWKLGNQYKITGEQIEATDRLIDKVDYIITDSPILLGALYARLYNKDYNLHDSIKSRFETYNNFNILLKRDFEFVHEARGSGKGAQQAEMLLEQMMYEPDMRLMSGSVNYEDILKELIRKDVNDHQTRDMV